MQTSTGVLAMQLFVTMYDREKRSEGRRAKLNTREPNRKNFNQLCKQLSKQLCKQLTSP